MLERTTSKATPDAVVMIFAGEYDIACREALRTELESIAAFQSIVLDLTDVTYFDSSAVHELARLHDVRVSTGLDRIALVVTNKNLQRIFAVLNLSALFTIVEDLKDVAPPFHKPAALEYSRCGHSRPGEFDGDYGESLKIVPAPLVPPSSVVP
jgi:anti-anti-sigma factor